MRVAHVGTFMMTTSPRDVRERAVQIFGLTEDLHEAGWILPDGRLLDFSGKNDGGTPGVRALDHREIGEAYDYEPSHTAAMARFRKEGNVRFHLMRVSRDVSVDFTRGTLTTHQLRQIARALQGAVSLNVDVHGEDGEHVDDFGCPERRGNFADFAAWLQERGHMP